MFTRLLKLQFIKRLNHTNIKSKFPENSNKVIEHLINTQNRKLTELSEQNSGL